MAADDGRDMVCGDEYVLVGDRPDTCSACPHELSIRTRVGSAACGVSSASISATMEVNLS